MYPEQYEAEEAADGMRAYALEEQQPPAAPDAPPQHVLQHGQAHAPADGTAPNAVPLTPAETALVQLRVAGEEVVLRVSRLLAQAGIMQHDANRALDRLLPLLLPAPTVPDGEQSDDEPDEEPSASGSGDGSGRDDSSSGAASSSADDSDGDGGGGSAREEWDGAEAAAWAACRQRVRHAFYREHRLKAWCRSGRVSLLTVLFVRYRAKLQHRRSDEDFEEELRDWKAMSPPNLIPTSVEAVRAVLGFPELKDFECWTCPCWRHGWEAPPKPHDAAAHAAACTRLCPKCHKHTHAEAVVSSSLTANLSWHAVFGSMAVVVVMQMPMRAFDCCGTVTAALRGSVSKCTRVTVPQCTALAPPS